MQATLFILFPLFLMLAVPIGVSADPLSVDSPPAGAIVTGVDNISGWACEADLIQARFDGALILTIPYGGTRGDTNTICGDDDNGFTLAWNWNLLAPGQHTLEILRNGEVCDTRTVTVINLGSEFLSGVSGRFTLPNFPELGQNVDVEWRQDKQNFTIVAFDDDSCAGNPTFTCTCTGITPGGTCGACGAGGDPGRVIEDVVCEDALNPCIFGDGTTTCFIEDDTFCDGSERAINGWTCVENM